MMTSWLTVSEMDACRKTIKPSYSISVDIKVRCQENEEILQSTHGLDDPGGRLHGPCSEQARSGRQLHGHSKI